MCNVTFADLALLIEPVKALGCSRNRPLQRMNSLPSRVFKCEKRKLNFELRIVCKNFSSVTFLMTLLIPWWP